MNFINQGTVSNMAYGTHIRQVGMTRGNRQGNNAFLQTKESNPEVFQQLAGFNLGTLFEKRKISINTMKILEKLSGKIDHILYH